MSSHGPRALCVYQQALSDDNFPANLLTLKQPDAIKGMIASGCPSDPKCFCEDKIFRLELLAGITTNCTAADMLSECLFFLAVNLARSPVFSP